MGLDLLEKRVTNSKRDSFRVNGFIRWLCIAMVAMAVAIFLALLVLVGVRFFFDVMHPP